MFTSLEEQMQHGDARAVSPKQRIMKWAAVVFVAVTVFGAMYYALQTIA